MFAPVSVRRRSFLLAAATMLSGPALVSGAPAGHFPDEIIVRYKPGAAAAHRAELRGRLRGTRLRDLGLIRGELVRLRGMAVERALDIARRDPQVEYAEPNWIVHALELLPDDPRFGELYGLRNSGQTGGTPGADIRATLAWEVTTGDPSLLVGVIDTGVDYEHPDLAANMWTNAAEAAGTPGVDDDGNGYVDDIHGYDFYNDDGDPMDDYGHGTHVAGTLAAVGNNGVGVVGVNWSCQIVAIKFLGASGTGTVAGAVLALQYAVAVGVRLTSNSWGGGPNSTALLDAIDAAGAANQLFVAAAGNEAQNTDASPQYPSAFPSPHIVAVAATDDDDQLASFSNYGLDVVNK